MVSEIINNEEDDVAAGALQRCFNSLLSQTSGLDGFSQETSFSEIRESEVMFTEQDISFTEGVDPHRVGNIMDNLRATLELLHDRFWTENAAALASLPVNCSGCDSFGHSTNDSRHVRDMGRAEEGFLPAAQHVSGQYVLQKLGCTTAYDRVVSINDQMFEIGKASRTDNNCLIDTIRQTLNIPASDVLLDAVRNDLARASLKDLMSFAQVRARTF